MGNNQQTRRKFLKLFGISTFSLYFGCNGAQYLNLRKNCSGYKEKNRFIRVLSFNIANARGNNDNFFGSQSKEKIFRNLNWISEVIRNYQIDVACLNEVDFNSIRTQGIDMAKYIAENVCYNHIISEKLFSIPSVLEVGNAVISRFPLKLNMYRQYGVNFFDQAKNAFKSFLDFDVLLEGQRSLNFTQTHLDNLSDEVRCGQMKILRDHLQTKTKPFVLLGDLNSTPDNKCFQNLVSKMVENPYLGNPTYPSEKPTVEIDYILASLGLRIENFHPIFSRNKVSDHLPVIGDIIID